MSPTARYQLALAMAENHADRCAVCEPPSLDRSGAGCRRGRVLDQQWIGHWRKRIVVLIDRGRH